MSLRYRKQSLKDDLVVYFSQVQSVLSFRVLFIEDLDLAIGSRVYLASTVLAVYLKFSVRVGTVRMHKQA